MCVCVCVCVCDDGTVPLQLTDVRDLKLVVRRISSAGGGAGAAGAGAGAGAAGAGALSSSRGHSSHRHRVLPRHCLLERLVWVRGLRGAGGRGGVGKVPSRQGPQGMEVGGGEGREGRKGEGKGGITHRRPVEGRAPLHLRLLRRGLRRRGRRLIGLSNAPITCFSPPPPCSGLWTHPGHVSCLQREFKWFVCFG